MEYVGRNLKSFIKKEPIIFGLMIICVITSVIVVFFSFGLYHHLEQKKMDAKLGQTNILIGLDGEEADKALKGEVVKACMELPQDILQHCYFTASAQLRDADKIDNEMLSTLVLHFSIKNGKISVANIGDQLKKQKYIVEGDWFTANQIENGDQVCIAFDPNTTYMYQDQKSESYCKQFEPKANGKYVVDGKEYTCIGYQDRVVTPLVPITTLEDDIVIAEVGVFGDKVINREQYNAIQEVFEEYFGNAVYIAPLAIPDLDATEFYTTLTVCCVLMAVLSGVVLAMLYEYILLKRRKQLTIFRLCGLSLAKVRRMYIMECMLITMISMTVAFVLFWYGVLPWTKNIYEYIAQSYTWRSCGLLGIMYLSGIVAVLSIMLRIKFSNSIFETYCE